MLWLLVWMATFILTFLQSLFKLNIIYSTN